MTVARAQAEVSSHEFTAWLQLFAIEYEEAEAAAKQRRRPGR